MNVLVTGANGFVGSMACRKFLDAGHRVRGLVRETSDLSLLAGLDVERVTGSLDDPESLSAAAYGMDLVIHTAAAVTDWGTRDYFYTVNVEGTEHMLDAAVSRGVKRFVLVSSIAVHNFIGASDLDENAPMEYTPFPYCATKREAEVRVTDAGEAGRIETVIIRPGDIYGPGDRVSLLKMAPMLESGRMALLAGGKTLGAFTYVENLADALVLAGTRPEAAGRVYVITDGVKMTWKSYFETLTRELGVRPPRMSVPAVAAGAAAAVLETGYRWLGVRSRPLVTRYLVDQLRHDVHFSIARARRELGYEPRIPVDEAIRRTAAWYRAVVRGEETAWKHR